MSLYAQISIQGTALIGTTQYGRVIISIYDSSTGQPTNGNNCSVVYTQNINGLTSTNTTTVSGISTEVYSGEISDSSTGYYTNFTIVSVTPGAGIPPNPAADDLTIVNIITTPESAVGAGDGTITINATSSFPPIQYSIDNVHWQSSSKFTGQHTGYGTAYVKDNNSGAVNQSYDVGLVGNILVSDPSVTLSPGNVSRWNAAFNNIWFKFQRKDFEITSITQNVDGNILVAVNGNVSQVKVRTTITSTVFGVPTVTSPGDFVYINTALYQGSYECLQANTGSLVLALTWTINDTIGFCNINSLRPYYNIQLIITYANSTGSYSTITVKGSPFPDGHCWMDISSFLKSLVNSQDNSGYNLVNYRDANLSASYTVKYAELWNGQTSVQWATLPYPYYVLYTARQIQQLGGGNMQQFVPFLLGFQPGLWITDFTMPVYSYGFPFDMSFIFSEYMTGTSPYYIITLLDFNQNPLNPQTIPNQYLINTDGSFILNQDGSKFLIAPPNLINVSITQTVGLNRLLINFQPPTNCFYFTIQVFYDLTPPSGTKVTYPLTVSQLVRLDINTPDRPVYLRWIGLTGSWNYYRFCYNQIYGLDVTNETLIKNFVTDWANTQSIQQVVQKNAGKKLQVMAENVSNSDIIALEGIKTSPQVQMYMNSGKWQTVDTGAQSYTEHETFIDYYNFSVTLMLPERNLQTL